MNNKKFETNRYIKNMIIPEIGKIGQEKLHSTKVLVAGLGGVGSNIITQLASLGIGTLGLIDNDNVEISNLNRQFIHKYSSIGLSKVDSATSWIQDYNPDIQVKGYKIKLDEFNYKDIISEYDLIVDCFDNSKSMFLLNKISLETKKPLVTGGCYSYGGFVFTIIPGDGACLGCIRPDNDIDTYLTEDEKEGIISPTVAVISSIMAKETFKLIMGLGTSLNGHGLFYDGLSMQFKKIKCERKTTCKYCSGL